MSFATWSASYAFSAIFVSFATWSASYAFSASFGLPASPCSNFQWLRRYNLFWSRFLRGGRCFCFWGGFPFRFRALCSGALQNLLHLLHRRHPLRFLPMAQPARRTGSGASLSVSLLGRFRFLGPELAAADFRMNTGPQECLQGILT